MRFTIALMVTLLAVPLFAQPAEVREAPEERRTEEIIETDRDSFTPSTRTAGKKRLIVEAAHSFIDNRGIPETHSFPEILLRFGATERLELRLGWNYEVGGGGNDVSGTAAEDLEGPGIEREHRVLYGFKAAVTEQDDDFLPDSVLILQGYTPTGGKATDSQFVATYAAGWELSNDWKLDAALRYATSSEEADRFDVWAPSIVLKVPVLERWNVHGEYFGLFSRDRETDFVRHYVSPGVHYLIAPDLEVGVRVGWGLNDQASRFFCNTGFGFRF